MKSFMFLCLALVLAVSCAHKKSDKPSYSPVVSFQEGQDKFNASVELPKGFKEKIPLVVIVHEWWGRTPYIESRSKMLNDEGFATLAIDLFGNGKVVDNPKAADALATPFYKNPELGISRLNKYIELAKRDPHIDASKIYVMGYCFGGAQALNLARSGADIKGVVGFHAALASPYSIKDKVKARVLALQGGADPMVPAKDLNAFDKEMKEAGVDYKMIVYPGVKHSFTNPRSTEIGRKHKLPVAYDKAADEASWQEFLKFLKQ